MRRSPTLSERMMARAVQLARRGFPAPNPHVGCVLVQGETIVGEGFHHHAGGPHAEIAALTDAGPQARGSTAYITMEPCNHYGRTGPCSLALIEAGIAKVVYATPDPNPKAMGGAEVVRAAGIAVERMTFPEAEDADELWLTAVRRKRPYVILKAAVGLDGRLALPSGESKWITAEKARQAGMRLRAEAGCVLVGAGTVLRDDPRLTARLPGVVNQPLRAIMADRPLSLESHAMSGEAGETVIVTADVSAALSDLWDRGVTSILVEGGTRTHSRFLTSGLVDRLELFMAPRILGQGPAWASFVADNPLAPEPAWTLSKVRRLGADMQLTYRPAK